MTNLTDELNACHELDDVVLDEVVGGKLPDFMYELAEKFEPKTREEILRHLRTNCANVAEPYRYLVQQLRKIRDYDSAKRVENYFFERYHLNLRG